MKFEKVNIGLLIEQKMNELDINKSEMARRSGIANQNINRVFERSSIDTDKLVAISEALDFNFFDCFRTKEEQGAATADNGGVAVAGNGTAHHITTNASADAAVLQERIKSLEALLAEKERLIKVYERMVEK
jgi:DNA-binding Xre family transcriptional regulator